MRRTLFAAVAVAIVLILVLLLRPRRGADSGKAEPLDTSSAMHAKEGTASTRRTRNAPPQLAPPALSTTALPTDPRDPGYDALALVMAKGWKAHEIFEQEPRDAAWAQQRETLIGYRLKKDFGAVLPQVQEILAECRQTSCRIEIKLPEGIDKAQRQTALELLQLTTFGERSDVDTSKANAIVLNNVVSNEMRNSPQYQQILANFRRVRIERRIKSPTKTYIPAHKLDLNW